MSSIQVRPALLCDSDQIASIHFQSWRETYGGLLPGDYIERQTLENRQTLWKGALSAEIEKRPFVFVAEKKDQDLVGFSAAGKPFSPEFLWNSELYAIYVRQSAQRNGIGRALLKAVCESLVDAGHSSVGLWVLKENQQARQFYERYGAIVRSEHSEIENGTEVVDIAIGWDNISHLTDRLLQSK